MIDRIAAIVLLGSAAVMVFVIVILVGFLLFAMLRR
jgi:hypothetical protein